MEKSTEEKKQFVKLGFNQEETTSIVEALNNLLANYHVFYQKLRNYHWNVTGGDFFDLHDKFEELYLAAIENIDSIAERIKVFGHTPMSTLKDYLEHSEITETGTDLNASEMLREVLADIETMDSFLIEAVDTASEVGDVATVGLLNRMIGEIEKQHWMLSAFSGK